MYDYKIFIYLPNYNIYNSWEVINCRWFTWALFLAKNRKPFARIHHPKSWTGEVHRIHTGWFSSWKCRAVGRKRVPSCRRKKCWLESRRGEQKYQFGITRKHETCIFIYYIFIWSVYVYTGNLDAVIKWFELSRTDSWWRLFFWWYVKSTVTKRATRLYSGCCSWALRQHTRGQHTK